MPLAQAPTSLASAAEALAQRSKQGVFFATAAYSMWGIAPIYFKAISQVPALEILAHRIFWSLA